MFGRGRIVARIKKLRPWRRSKKYPGSGKENPA
jgi:hypothetical protein